MTLQYFTLVHILISLMGIATGFGAVSGLLAAKLFPRWIAFFLATTAITSLTGFFFPFGGITPAIAVGIISLLTLAAASYALYGKQLDEVWRNVFVINAVLSLYLNFFVLVVQLFQKMPALIAIAPTRTELPFVITQVLVLLTFIWLGIAATRRFLDQPNHTI